MSARRRAFASTLVIVLAAVVLVVWHDARDGEQPASERASPTTTRDAALLDSVALPRIRADDYRRLARDATREERLLIDGEALALGLADARAIDDALFEPLGGVELDAAHCAAVLAASDASRGRLFRARGRIATLVHVDASERIPEHWRGRLELEDGASAFFAVLAVPDGAAAGDFVRIDGLFLEVASEATSGGWLDSPLIAGARAVRSFPALGPVKSLAGVDAQAPDAALWTLVAYARDAQPESIEWSSAPLLDRELATQLANDEAAWRCRPVRIAGARLQDVEIAAQDENPARVGSMTRGWLGSWDWMKSGHGLVQFVSANTKLDLRTGDEVDARGFFVRNQSYTSAGRGAQIAPLFVLQSLERHVAPPPASLGRTLAIFALVGAGVLALGCLAVRRDQRQSRAFELARRRTAKPRALA